MHPKWTLSKPYDLHYHLLLTIHEHEARITDIFERFRKDKLKYPLQRFCRKIKSRINIWPLLSFPKWPKYYLRYLVWSQCLMSLSDYPQQHTKKFSLPPNQCRPASHEEVFWSTSLFNRHSIIPIILVTLIDDIVIIATNAVQESAPKWPQFALNDMRPLARKINSMEWNSRSIIIFIHSINMYIYKSKECTMSLAVTNLTLDNWIEESR